MKGLRPIFATFTFEENLTDKSEARRRWKSLRERLVRAFPDIEAVGVWQRQQRGAWHLHLVLNRIISIEVVRDACEQTGWGRFVDLKVIGGRKGFRTDASLQSVSSVARYVTRYITRDLEGDAGEHLTVYIAAKAGTTKFGWGRGFCRLVRIGRTYVYGMDPEHRPFGRDVAKYAHDFLARIGWESLEWIDRHYLLASDRGVWRWFYGPPGPANSVEPF